MQWGNDSKGKVTLVGFGPGSLSDMTFRAREAIRDADVVVGYTTYIELVRDLLEGKEVVETGMQEEVERAQRAVDRAEEGRHVAVVSSGDPGVYGLAGLVLEVLRERGWTPDHGIGIEVVPGASAINSCAALVGAPLMHDFAAISLSDLLTPWEIIVERIEAAAKADFVIGLYNPASGRRTHQIVDTQAILQKYRRPTTPVAIIKSGYREGQQVVLTNLEHMLDYKIGMLVTMVIGNSSTYVYEGLMITPRGYHHKYRLGDTTAPETISGTVPELTPSV